MIPVTALLEYVETLGIQLWIEAGELKYRAPNGKLSNDLRGELSTHKREIINYIEINGQNYREVLEAQRRLADSKDTHFLPIINQNRVWRAARPGAPPNADSNKFHIVLRMTRATSQMTLAAITDIVQKDEALLAQVEEFGGVPVLNLQRNFPFMIRRFDVSAESNEVNNIRASALASNSVWTGFDFKSEPLFRCFEIRFTEGESLVGVVFHHLISNPNTVSRFFNEIVNLCAAKSTEERMTLLKNRRTLTGHLKSTIQWLRRPEAYAQLLYWKRQLVSAPKYTALRNIDKLDDTCDGIGEVSFTLDHDDTESIRKVSARLQITPFMLLMAAHTITLCGISNQYDVVINVPYSGAGGTRMESSGMVANHYYIRIILSDAMRFIDVIEVVRKTFAEAVENGTLPFECVVENVCKDYLYVPIFNFFPFVSIEKKSKEDWELLGEKIDTPLPQSASGGFYPPETTYSLMCFEGSDFIRGVLAYRNRYYDAIIVKLFIRRYSSLLRSFGTKTTCTVAEYYTATRNM